MKNKYLVIFFCITALTPTSIIYSQKWDVGLDLFSSLVWRGSKYGTGPALQPSVDFSFNNLVVVAWGNYCFSDDEATEAAIYMLYDFEISKSKKIRILISDYYFPDDKWFDKNSHYVEPMIEITVGKFGISSGYLMNHNKGNFYLETRFSMGVVDLTIGAGNHNYTLDGSLQICNIALTTKKIMKITESFSIPLVGSVVLNPDSEQFNVVAGILL